jgi:uncharacterized protein YjdB
MFRIVTSATAIAVLASGCFGRLESGPSGEIPPPPPPPSIAVSIGPADAALAVGKSLQLQATTNISAVGWSWTSQNPGNAQVSAAGVVLGVQPGAARIQACPANTPSFCGVVDLTIVAIPPEGPPSVSVSPGTFTLGVGQSLEYQATAVNFAAPAWVWNSMDPNTATITAAGVLTGRRQGGAVVAACAPTPPRYCGTAIVTVQ